MGGGAGHTEEQQRPAYQRPPGVHVQCGGVEKAATLLQGIRTYSHLRMSINLEFKSENRTTTERDSVSRF